MALFEAKYCSLCETKLSLFGTTRLANGQLCKNCSSKLSPLLTHVRKRTIGEIQSHLQYREENQKQLENFHPDLTFGNHKKIFVDSVNRLFCVARKDYLAENADLFSFDQIQGVDVHINENKEELYTEDSEGKSVSYDPPQYEYDYEFIADIDVNSVWFDDINVDLSDGDHPDQAWSESFSKYEEQLRKLRRVLLSAEMGELLWEKSETEETEETAEVNENVWVCVKCGKENEGKFCTECGAPRPSYRCAVCGYELKSREMLPRYCINCGNKMNQY